MNILFLAPRLPLPADTGGKIRTLNILRQTAKCGRLHLVCFQFEKSDAEFARTLEQESIRVTLVPLQEPSLPRRLLQIVFNPLPYSIAKYHSPAMERVLAGLNRTERFDALHVDHLHMAHYRGYFPGVPSFLDEHNVEYKILERCCSVEKSPFKQWIFLDQARKMKRCEAQMLETFSQYFAVSEDDRRLLAELVQSAVPGQVIANGVDTEYFQSQTPIQNLKEDQVVFTGSMDWLPNTDAVLFFCREILPLIWKSNAKVKFVVVGKKPAAEITALAQKEPRIVVTGGVEDIRPFVDQSKIFVVPIRVGGGTRLKILEAMSMRKAVVSTTVGAEGILHTAGENILLADEPADFARQVVTLLNNPSRMESIGIQARQLVCGRYDWNIVGQRLEKIYTPRGQKM